MLILDKADIILDIGFRRTMDHIIKSLPIGSSRQTLLFSETLRKSVNDLKRLVYSIHYL